MNDFNAETGELFTNGSRAATASASAAVQMQRDRMAYGANVLHAAVARAMMNIPIWVQSEKAGAHKVKYAPLKDILAAVRPPLATHGIRIRQGMENSRTADEGGGVKGRLIPVYTDLIHVDTGEVDRTIVEIPLTRLDPQAMGSAVTYGRRYSLLAALGLATDEADDDGEGAKLKGLHEKTENSAALDKLLAAMQKNKDPSKLTEWATDVGTQKAFTALSEAEQERFKREYGDFRGTLK